MSFNRLFLGGLLSSRARLRFTGWEYSAPNRLDKAVIVIDGMTGAKGPQKYARSSRFKDSCPFSATLLLLPSEVNKIVL
jgi:hypothetical protein